MLTVSSQKVGGTPTRPLGPFPQGSFPRNIEQVLLTILSGMVVGGISL
jgi:hypothetical protein